MSDIFSVFHDGGISGHVFSQDRLDLQIDIAYLAERVHPSYKTFHILLTGVEELWFSTWPKGPDAEPQVLRGPERIFEPELEILSSKSLGGLVEVICSQSSSECAYCGGELYFRADAAMVTDEGGREYSIEDLRRLSREYWDEWASPDD
ncbi:MAG TPA: hypothetical protein VFT46_08930 [Holophagaceae bacterium]|nr:hypothetical protein [Holophagaceae bacterium]